MKSGKMPCTTITRPKKTQYGPTGAPWHLARSSGKVVLIHSAFYDDRPRGGKLPSLHLLSISDVNDNSSLYCYVWYQGLTEPYVTKAKLFHIYFRHTNPEGMKHYLNSTEFFMEYVISCPLPTNQIIPTHISLTAKHCDVSDILVPVTVPQKPSKTIDFGICVGPSFGRLDEAKLVEWFELNKILGVKEFNIYNVSLDANIKSVFTYYISKKELILNEMPSIIPRYDHIAAHLNTLPVDNHCLFTNMYRYKQIVVVDFDEFITPKQNITYSQLIDKLNAKHKNKDWSSYMFFNQYFFNGYPSDTSQPEYSTVLRKRIRYHTSDYMYSPKSFINPQNCKLFMPHYCFESFLGGNNLITSVPADLAANHHYRECHYPSSSQYRGKCEEHLKTRVPDDTMLRYKGVLEAKVKQVLAHIGYFN